MSSPKSRKNKIGDTYGNLTIISAGKREKRKNDWGYTYFWNCKCACGKEIEVRVGGWGRNPISCGCLTTQLRSAANRKHGIWNHPLCAVYRSILHRCYNDKNSAFKYYGGRGIKVCDSWRENIMNFYNWAVSSGWQAGLQVDRVDNDKDYCPENCRFVTPAENSRNKRNNRMILINGQTMCLKDWTTKLNLPTSKVYKLDESKK